MNIDNLASGKPDAAVIYSNSHLLLWPAGFSYSSRRASHDSQLTVAIPMDSLTNT